MRLRVLVGVAAHHRLQHGGANLIGERDDADLREAQCELALQQGIDGDDQRLDHVVEEVREADGAEHVVPGPGGAGLGLRMSRQTLLHAYCPNVVGAAPRRSTLLAT